MGIVTQLKGQIYNYHNALVASHRDMAIATRDFGKSLEFVERFGFGHYSVRTSDFSNKFEKNILTILMVVQATDFNGANAAVERKVGIAKN